MKQIIVFTNEGKTYEFNDFSELKPLTQGFSFKYTGNATGITRTAFFNYTSVSGYAIADLKNQKGVK